MSDDLVKELRFWNGGHKSDEKMAKAADRIEQLEAALRNIIGALEDPNGGQYVFGMRFASSIACAALREKKDD